MRAPITRPGAVARWRAAAWAWQWLANQSNSRVFTTATFLPTPLLSLSLKLKLVNRALLLQFTLLASKKQRGVVDSLVLGHEKMIDHHILIRNIC